MALKRAWKIRKNRSAGARRWLELSKLKRMERISELEAEELAKQVSPRRVAKYDEPTELR